MLDADLETAPNVALGVHGTLRHCTACNIANDAYDHPHEVGLADAYVGYASRNYMVAGALVVTHGEGLESGEDRFGYGSMFLVRAGRVDGLRFELGLGFVVTDIARDGGPGGGAAFVLHNALYVPLFRRGRYQLELEARSEFAIPDPFFWIPTVGLRVRAGPVVFGGRAQLMSKASALMLFVGYRAGGRTWYGLE